MSAVFDLNSAWVARYVDAAEQRQGERLVVRGLTDAQALRRVEYKLRELAGCAVAKLVVSHDPWAEAMLFDMLQDHEVVGFVHRRASGEMVAHLR